MHRPLFAAPAMALLLAAAGCGGSSDRSAPGSGAERYASNGTFTMAIVDDWGALDPYRTGYTLKMAYDSLVSLQPDGKFVSGLAQQWTVDPNTATFTLRSGVTCSDGTPLTAGQVAADLTYLGNPKNASPLYGLFVPTVPFSATADDAARTVKIKMKSPYGFLLNTIGQVPIMCGRGLKDPKLLKTTSDGTGPFVLTKVVPGQSYTFTVRKDYTWGPNGATTKAPGTPAKFVVRIVTNETTTANLLTSGEMNFAAIHGEDWRRLAAQGLRKVNRGVSGAWLWLNQIGGRPTADPRVRKALVQALDLGEVIKVNTQGNGGPATGLVESKPKPCPGDTVAGLLPPHDVAAAEGLLDQAGWTKGSDGIRRKDGRTLALAVHYWPQVSPLNKPTVELLQRRWQPLGIQVKLMADNLAGFNNVMYKTSDYDVYMMGFGLSMPTQAVPFLSGAIPPKGQNVSGVHNKNYDALIAKALTLTPPAACAYWNQAEQAIWRNLDLVPIAGKQELWFLKNAEAQISGWNIPIPTSIRVFR